MLIAHVENTVGTLPIGLKLIVIGLAQRGAAAFQTPAPDPVAKARTVPHSGGLLAIVPSTSTFLIVSVRSSRDTTFQKQSG